MTPEAAHAARAPNCTKPHDVIHACLERLTNCPRCGATAHDVVWLPFLRPIANWTLWTSCPMTGEPVLHRRATPTEAVDV